MLRERLEASEAATRDANMRALNAESDVEVLQEALDNMAVENTHAEAPPEHPEQSRGHATPLPSSSSRATGGAAGLGPGPLGSPPLKSPEVADKDFDYFD